MDKDFKAIDEKGFVFLDSNNNPYLIRIWENSGPWLFYWHPDKHWVSLRPVNQTDIWRFYPNRLSEERANLYHSWHDEYLRAVMTPIV
jgi:hypothetical protein